MPITTVAVILPIFARISANVKSRYDAYQCAHCLIKGLGNCIS